MDNQKGLMLVLWVIVLVGAFFLARGLTGKAVLDLTAKDQCSLNKECGSGMICCNGYCYPPEICNQITHSTNSFLETPQQQKNYLFDIGLGLLVLMAVLIAFFGIERGYRRDKTKEVKRVSRKSRRKKRR